MDYFDKDNPSVQQAFDDFFKKKNIEEQCTQESLVHLHEAFLISENNEMNIYELHEAFESILQITMSEDDFSVLFRKMNLKKDGYVTWNELISYLLLEFQEKDTALQWQTLELPITGAPKLLRSHHRTPICRIHFCPEVLPDRSVSFHRGCYVTVSRDGVINYWSLDLEYQRTVQSTNPYLKVQPTAITDMIVLPDLQIICTSSTERDLRFYDTVAKKFDLRVLIWGLESAVTSMCYYFNVNIKEDSYIVLGDMNGSIKVMSFNSSERGPFKQEPERDVLALRYEGVAKGELRGMKVTEMKNVHKDWVNQVTYYGGFRAFMSSSRCSDCSLLFSDPSGVRTQYRFRVNRGISCFTVCEESQILVTGGPDCIVRVWNPFVPKRANCAFPGHHTAICGLVIQNSGKRIYSLSKDRCIKVWDVLAQSCIQTYNGLPSELGEYTPMTSVYNTLTHKMIVASVAIAILVCEPVINQETSDGLTHTKPISCVLYNKLYKVIVSTGYDSCIIVWDPWFGRRLYLVTNAHSQILHGQEFNIEITSACFDDSEQLLVTGARDGTLKIWNFNTGTCIRNMAIGDQHEITSIVWIENRILCSGWNRRVTEFAATDTDIFQKSWSMKHTEEILCSTVRYPQVLATGTYNGEIILWRLETGQPYRKYQVNDVTARYGIKHSKDGKEKPSKQTAVKTAVKEQQVFKKSPHIEISSHQESALNITRIVAVRAMIFLIARALGPKTGTLLVSLDSGLIQVWAHHPAGGFLEAFLVIHATGDCALSLATDPENQFLVTGHSTGYIKVWLLSNYLIPDPPKVSTSLLRLEFPFLWKDRVEGRAKRAVRDQPLPILLSSLHGHTEAIVSIQIIPDTRIVLSGSADHTVRLWTLGGRYISTLGTFRPWTPILPNVPVHKYFENYRIPADIKRFASFTTMKVLRGGLKRIETEYEGKGADTKDFSDEGVHPLCGKRLTPTIVDRYFKFAVTAAVHGDQPVLDNSLAYVSANTS